MCCCLHQKSLCAKAVMACLIQTIILSQQLSEVNFAHMEMSSLEIILENLLNYILHAGETQKYFLSSREDNVLLITSFKP